MAHALYGRPRRPAGVENSLSGRSRRSPAVSEGSAQLRRNPANVMVPGWPPRRDVVGGRTGGAARALVGRGISFGREATDHVRHLRFRGNGAFDFSRWDKDPL